MKSEDGFKLGNHVYPLKFEIPDTCSGTFLFKDTISIITYMYLEMFEISSGKMIGRAVNSIIIHPKPELDQ